MEKFLIDQILKLVSDIDSSIDTLQKVNGTRKITEYLNIERWNWKRFKCLLLFTFNSFRNGNISSRDKYDTESYWYDRNRLEMIVSCGGEFVCG